MHPLLLLAVPGCLVSALLAGVLVRRRAHRLVNLQVDLLLDVARGAAVEDGADLLVSRIATELGADAAVLTVVDGETLLVTGLHGYWPHMARARLRAGEGLVGRAWASGTASVESDVRLRSDYLAGGPGLRSGAYVPGWAGGAVRVVLCLESRAGRPLRPRPTSTGSSRWPTWSR